MLSAMCLTVSEIPHISVCVSYTIKCVSVPRNRLIATPFLIYCRDTAIQDIQDGLFEARSNHASEQAQKATSGTSK